MSGVRVLSRFPDLDLNLGISESLQKIEGSLLMQRMMQASSGVYCGPLRLLAMEVFDTCNAAGTFCNLVTGSRSTLSLELQEKF